MAGVAGALIATDLFLPSLQSAREALQAPQLQSRSSPTEADTALNFRTVHLQRRPWKTLTDVDVTNTWWLDDAHYSRALQGDLASICCEAAFERHRCGMLLAPACCILMLEFVR